MSALDKLATLQTANHASRSTIWKAKCYPDKSKQKLLIAKHMSSRWFKGAVLSELQELRNEGGNSGHNQWSASTLRPSTAPTSSTSLPMHPSPITSAHKQQQNGEEEEEEVEEFDPYAHMGRTRKARTSQSDDMEGNSFANAVKDRLNQRPKSAHAKRQQFLDVLTSPANLMEDKVISRTMAQQCSLESRDPSTVFQYLKDNVSGAKDFKLRSDSYGTKQELDLRTAIKKVDSLGARKLGMAIVFDPSVVTEGRTVILRFKYILDIKRIHTHTSSNVWNGSVDRKNNAAEKFAASKGLPTPFAGVGRMQRSSSMPSMEAAMASAASYKKQAALSKSSSNLLALASDGSSSSGGGRKSTKKKFGATAAKSKPTTIEVDYHINTARKCHYDLKLTTNPKARAVAMANDMPMFLPGWEGCLPLFIPAGFALCQVLVVAVGEELSWPQSPASPWSPSPGGSRPASAALPSRPTSAFGSADFSTAFDESNAKLLGRTSSTKDLIKEMEDQTITKGSTMTLSGFAFPAESVHRALHTLKDMENGVKKQLSNFIVPGGQPALHVAALHGNSHACRCILENGADPNLRNQPTLLTALHEAVLGGSRDCVATLLEFGANERQVDSAGNTPLHLACETGDLPCCNLLMRSRESAKVLISQNKSGKTPLAVVRSNTMRQTVERGMRMHHLVVPIQGKRKKIV